MATPRQLDEKEKSITNKNLVVQEKRLRILEYQLKKTIVELDGLPLAVEQYMDKIVDLEEQVKATKQAVSDAKRLLTTGAK